MANGDAWPRSGMYVGIKLCGGEEQKKNDSFVRDSKVAVDWFLVGILRRHCQDL
jgi:hypothetical protein